MPYAHNRFLMPTEVAHDTDDMEEDPEEDPEEESYSLASIGSNIDIESSTHRPPKIDTRVEEEILPQLFGEPWIVMI